MPRRIRQQYWTMQHKIIGVSVGVAFTSLMIECYRPYFFYEKMYVPLCELYNSATTQFSYDKEEYPFFPDAFTPSYKEPKLEYLSSDPRGYVRLKQITYKNIVGASTSAECYKEKIFGFNNDVCYNCLGWAMWEKEWLQLPNIRYVGKESLVRAVKDFIDVQPHDVNKQFSLASRLFPTFQEADCSNPKHNMIAFYFECIDNDNYLSCKWVHAARYLGKFNFNKEGREANLWTSKDGVYYLLSHEKLSDIASLYGETAICLAPEDNI